MTLIMNLDHDLSFESFDLNDDLNYYLNDDLNYDLNDDLNYDLNNAAAAVEAVCQIEGCRGRRRRHPAVQRVRREGRQALLLRRPGLPQLQGILQAVGSEQVSILNHIIQT